MPIRKSKKGYKIDRLQVAYDSNYLVNTGPIKFSKHSYKKFEKRHTWLFSSHFLYKI